MKSSDGPWIPAGPDTSLLTTLLAPRHPGVGFVLAALLVGIATALRWYLGYFEASIVPFALYYPAVLLTALAAGLWPGIFAIGLSATLASTLFMGGATGFPTLPSQTAEINVGVFVVTSFLMVAVAAQLRQTHDERSRLTNLFTVAQSMALDGVVIFEAIRGGDGTIVDFRRIYMNGAAERLLGPAKILIGRRYLETSPTARRDHLFKRYVEVMTTGIPAEEEFRFEAGNRWIYNVAARVDGDQLAITFRDITTLRDTIQQQRFLMRELNHRVKNVLTSVLSLARQTSTDHSASGYREMLTARISAMARAHDLLMTESWESARLCDIVAQTLAPYDRIFAQGPQVSVSADLALSINMVLHELATNAAKYGALSDPDGHVEIRWDDAGGGNEVTLVWRERGGPAVSAPSRRGFGSRILTRGFNSDTRRASLVFAPEGVECTLTFEAQATGAEGERQFTS